MLQDLNLGTDTVDVSMATLASVWARDPCDLRERQHEPQTVWDSEGAFDGSPPAGLMWAEQLSPHLQRNKQLQDTLLQREEELARLQEENNKLREFLNSSFVRNLEEKAKKLTVDGMRNLKRKLIFVNNGPFLNCDREPVATEQVSKRVCRNLTAQFCSESPETSASSEPNLDLWVLRTLGLKDRDTIDTSSQPLSSFGYSLKSLAYDAAASVSSQHNVNTSFSSPVTTSTPTVDIYCQSATCPTGYGYSTTKRQDATPAKSSQNGTTSPSHPSEFTATGLTEQFGAPALVMNSCNAVTPFQSPLLPEELPFTQSPDRTQICPITASNEASILHENPVQPLEYWSPLQRSQPPSHDTIQVSPAGEKVQLPPILLSSPVTNQCWTPIHGFNLTSPSLESQPPATPHTLRNRTDLAFSMSLSPCSSVKTHSFPQGQAFVRKDNVGRWNFTWVPRQGP
ncbi:hypothetical protein Q5P01_009506 [Channa striata]|uniref:Geminin coiled-coil domain containing n=1 Tax=Channa striata TaxID=64152 RepID=A0AA88SXI3_CHASR|nr:hypothetical protein Q5P01_009506 [Channa striata]